VKPRRGFATLTRGFRSPESDLQADTPSTSIIERRKQPLGQQTSEVFGAPHVEMPHIEGVIHLVELGVGSRVCKVDRETFVQSTVDRQQLGEFSGRETRGQYETNLDSPRPRPLDDALEPAQVGVAERPAFGIPVDSDGRLSSQLDQLRRSHQSGTFDQGGNLFEWNETTIGSIRVVRGGSFGGSQISLAAANQGGLGPSGESLGVGFRVASPAPPFWQGVPALSPFGMAVLWALLGFGGWRRLRA
jgi:hypothetical protein